MDRLRRKIDQYLIDWKNSSNKMPLIIKVQGKLEKQMLLEILEKKTIKLLLK